MKPATVTFRLANFVICLCATTLSFAASAAATATPLAPTSGGFMLQLLSGLIMVLITIVGLAWLLKKINRLPNKGQDAMEIVATLSLSPRERLIIVRSGDLKLLLGVAPGHIATLHVLAGEDAAHPPPPSHFAKLMADPAVLGERS
tara:strand:+ start:6101 stop:6538 length:438 start_codon:yes stop_codon:yes gene_type:complete